MIKPKYKIFEIYHIERGRYELRTDMYYDISYDSQDEALAALNAKKLFDPHGDFSGDFTILPIIAIR